MLCHTLAGPEAERSAQPVFVSRMNDGNVELVRRRLLSGRASASRAARRRQAGTYPPDMVRRCLQRTLPLVSKRFAAWSALNGGYLLPSEVFNKTAMLPGRTSELERVLGDLCLRKELAAASMGGSVTFGHGLDAKQKTWPRLLQAALSTVWNANVTMRNCAVAATSADFAALCYDSLVGGPTSVNFVEYSHNTKNPELFEPLLQQTLARNTLPFIVDYFHLAQPSTFLACAIQRGSVRLLPGGKFHIAQVEGTGKTHKPGFTSDGRLCRWQKLLPNMQGHRGNKLLFRKYELPMVSSQPIANWLPSQPERTALRAFVSRDGRHATMMMHEQLSLMVTSMLFAAHQRLAAESPAKGNVADVTSRPHGFTREPSICSVGPAVRKHVRNPSDGWRFVVENDKAGFLANTSGSTLQLQLDAGYAGSTLYLGFLKSYEHMGKVRLSCHAGCACVPLDVDAHDGKHHHSLSATAKGVKLLAANDTQSSPCVLHLRVANETRSDGHKFKVTSLTLVPERLASRMRPSKIGYQTKGVENIESAER